MSQSIRPQTRSADGPPIRYAESEPRDDHATPKPARDSLG
jgi:hypothetical protein